MGSWCVAQGAQLVLCVGLEGWEEQGGMEAEEGGICVFIQLMHSVVHDVVKQLYSSKKRNM